MSYQDKRAGRGDSVPILPERITGPLEITDRQLNLEQDGYSRSSPDFILSDIHYIPARIQNLFDGQETPRGSISVL